MENETNYLKEYYKKGEEKDFKGLLDNSDEITNNEKIQNIKRNIAHLRKMIESQATELSQEITKVYSKRFEPITGRNVLEYNGHFFDIETGAKVDEIEDNDTITGANTKNGTSYFVVGYDFSMASLFVQNIKYNIATNNESVRTKVIEQYIIPFLEDGAYKKGLEEDNEPTYIQDTYFVRQALARIKNNYFINKLYNIEYDGVQNLRELYEEQRKNKSFEIIMKTAPKEIKDLLLKMELEESQPINKILGLDIEIYNEAIKRGIIEDVVYCSKYIKEGYKTIQKSQKEWLNYIEDLKTKEEDLQFYGISYSRYWNDNGAHLIDTILSFYCDDRYNNLSDYYTLGQFTKYVIDESINQGYTNVRDFISELTDYLRLCKAEDIKPTLYSSYLKQTHDITSRNHKIRVERESEDLFKTQYKDFKTCEIKNYKIIAPSETNDLKKEGDNLNHCVASYIKRVIDGECKIFFLRKDENESLITFEVRHGAIVQVRGAHNRKANEEESAILKEYATSHDLQLEY